jgi:aspartate/methionine/tyrosine aminotransferase
MEIAKNIKHLEHSAIRKILAVAPPDAINLGLGEIQFPTPKLLIDHAKQILESKQLGYTPNAGLSELRSSICDYYNTDFKNNVCVTNGAEEALFATFFSYLNPGDEVVIADPTFLAYRTIAEMLGAEVKTFDLDPEKNFSLNEESFLKSFSNKTKIVVLNNPSNPMGTCFSSDEISKIVEVCSSKKVLLVVDEVYRELFIDSKPDSFLKKNADVICISSLSKSHCLSGWRVGWAISRQPKFIEPIIKVHQYIATCAPALSQEIAILALTKTGMRESEILRQHLMLNRKIVFDNLPDINTLPNNSSPYLFVQINKNDIDFSYKLAESGVVVIPGSAFGVNSYGWIRVNYGIEKDALLRGLKILRNCLNG